MSFERDFVDSSPFCLPCTLDEFFEFFKVSLINTNSAGLTSIYNKESQVKIMRWQRFISHHYYSRIYPS